MASLTYSIQSPVRSRTNPSSKIQLCRSYGCFAIAPKPAEEKGLLWSSQTKTGFVPKSSSLCFRLNGSSMGFRKCSFSSCAKGGDGDVDSVRVTNDFIFFGSMVAITAFAAKYISPAWEGAFFISSVFAILYAVAAAAVELENLQGWLYLKRSQPFSLGDTIKVVYMEEGKGMVYVEGKVEKMGLITTLLLSEQNSLITLPNSLFSSEAILNLSRRPKEDAQLCSDDHAKAILNLSRPCARRIVTSIRLYIHDLSVVPLICDDVEKMLNSNPMIFLEKKRPYCRLLTIVGGDTVFTLRFTLKAMSGEGAFNSAKQDILLQALDMIKWHAGIII